MARTSTNVRKELEQAVIDYNTAMLEDKPSVAGEISERIENLVDEFNKVSAIEIYEKCDCNVKKAIETRFYPAIRFKTETDLETQTVRGIISDIEKEIDLEKFEHYCKKAHSVDVMVDTKWKFALQRFGQLMTIRTIASIYEDDSKKEFAINACTKSYFLAKKAAEMKLGDNPTSNTKTIRALQSIVDMVLYDEKEFVNKSGNTVKTNSHTVTKEDLAFIDRVFCRENTGKKTIGVKTLTNAGMARLFRHILWKIVCGKTYEAEYKSKTE